MLLMLDLKFLVYDYFINPLKQRVLKFATTFCVIKGGISLSVWQDHNSSKNTDTGLKFQQ